MMKTLFQLCILLISVTSFAQNRKMFEGTINYHIKITMYIDGLDDGTYADTIIGTYKYRTQNDYLLVDGYRNYKGNIILVEKSTANFSGIFLGKISNGIFKGKWISDDQKKSYPFELQEVEAPSNEKKIFEDAITEKLNQLRNY